MKRTGERKHSKRVKPQVGDLCAVKLSEDRWGLAHIVAGEDVATCYVLFAKHAASVEELRAVLEEATREPIAAVVSNDTEVRLGTWPVLGQRVPDYPSITLPQLTGVGSTWYTPGCLSELIEAYGGLRFWDEYPGTPKANRAMLLPHLPVPGTARFRTPPHRI